MNQVHSVSENAQNLALIGLGEFLRYNMQRFEEDEQERGFYASEFVSEFDTSPLRKDFPHLFLESVDSQENEQAIQAFIFVGNAKIVYNCDVYEDLVYIEDYKVLECKTFQEKFCRYFEELNAKAERLWEAIDEDEFRDFLNS